MSRIGACVFAVMILALPASAKEPAEVSPAEAKGGQVGEWKTEDGLVYRYRLPRSWDPEVGANLVVILHGSNLDRRWGFANHDPKTFRPDDIVVSPDGTTSNGQGGFNSLGQPADVKRFRGLLEELKASLRVRQTYLYGHSQGSFFAIHYAGEQPEDVDGLVAHASGVWTWSKGSKRGHHQAVVLMHGTQDPVVPYGQSVGGYEWFREKRYPHVRLVSLEGWNHWPAEHNGPVPHTSQELSWCVGMTAREPQDLEAAFAFLADVGNEEVHDWVALDDVAARVLERSEDMPAALLRRAEKARQIVADLAAAHVKALPDTPGDELEAEAWIGHLPVFLRAYAGTAAAEAYREGAGRLLEKQEKAATKHFGAYWKARRKGDERDAFLAGVDVLEDAFLHAACWDASFLGALEETRNKADELDIPKKALKRYDRLSKDLAEARKDGWKAFASIQKRVGKKP